MNLLLDTHIIIWMLAAPERLSQNTQKYLMDAEGIWVSAASIWEVCIKIQIGKLSLDLPTFIREIKQIGIQSLAITWEHAEFTKKLPLYHKDPFDRFLIAQAMSQPLTLLTNYEVLTQYGQLIKHVDSI